MNNYTSIDQSKKLLELGLGANTADMCYGSISCDSPGPYCDVAQTHKPDLEFNDLPCWSLSALLEMILGMSLKSSKSFHLSIEDGEYCMCYNDSSNGDYEEFVGSTPLEAAYHTVCWLLENNYIEGRK